MAEKITETTERWCCDDEKGDLVKYEEERAVRHYKCKHCGDLWVSEWVNDGAGSRMWDLNREEK